MKWVCLLLFVFLFGCAKDIVDLTTQFPVATLDETSTSLSSTTTMSTTEVTTDDVTTTTCYKDVNYSVSTLEEREVKKNRSVIAPLSFEVLDYVKKFDRDYYNEYVFFKNDDFTSFSNEMNVVGEYKDTGVLEVEGVNTSFDIEIENTGKNDGVFLVERTFPGIDKYYIDGSDNVKSVVVKSGEVGKINFDFDVLCYRIATILKEVNLMDYYVSHSENVHDMKDYYVNQDEGIVYACVRGHYKITAPLVEVKEEVTESEMVVVNEQGSDRLRFC